MNAHTSQQTQRYLAVSGAIAGLFMVVFMLLLRNVSETRSLVELLAGATLQLMPIGIFSFLLGLFQGLAKALLLLSVILGMIAAGALFARLDRGPGMQTSTADRIRRILTLTVSLWIPAVIFALLATSFGTSIALTNQELIAIAWTLFLDFLVFAVAMHVSYLVISGAWTVPREVQADAPPADLHRRQFLGWLGTGTVALASLAYLGRFVSDARSGVIGGGSNTIPLPITPIPAFYTISKNFIDPTVELSNWALDIRGLVEQSVTLSYEQLLSLPSVEQTATLICISNEVGGELISNAVWTGVKLSDVLAEAGIRPQAQKVAFFGTDGYNDSFPMSKALEPTTIVAYRMNGERLPDKHGFPARLIVPGKYGIKNGKWLRRIELVETFRGYWQERGWTEEATIKTMSRFDIPAERAIVDPGLVDLGGVAFAGDRGIQDVQISADNGQSWQSVDSVEQIAPLSWVIWRTVWSPPGEGAYTLRVRAIDGEGTIQTEETANPIPDGASGYHRVAVGVT
ncbi:MAG: molybdopterin-dependent oxidoreductase [Chloroflexia bacterium]|nr:molybdopterin-dependent oxidoreductase [Chloroflexia bacterium]